MSRSATEAAPVGSSPRAMFRSGWRRGQPSGLVGESGSGKSTVLRAIAGLIPHAQGRVILAGREMPARRSTAERKMVQMVFQDPYGSLHPNQTVDQTLEHADRHPPARRLRSPHRFGAARGRLGPRAPLPISPPALGRPAPTRCDRTGARAGAQDPAARRTDIGAGRVGAGRDPEPARQTSAAFTGSRF